MERRGNKSVNNIFPSTSLWSFFEGWFFFRISQFKSSEWTNKRKKSETGTATINFLVQRLESFQNLNFSFLQNAQNLQVVKRQRHTFTECKCYLRRFFSSKESHEKRLEFRDTKKWDETGVEIKMASKTRDKSMYAKEERVWKTCLSFLFSMLLLS